MVCNSNKGHKILANNVYYPLDRNINAMTHLCSALNISTVAAQEFNRHFRSNVTWATHTLEKKKKPSYSTSQFCACYQKDISHLEQSSETSIETGLKFNFANLREYKCNVFGYERAKIDNCINQIFICQL